MLGLYGVCGRYVTGMLIVASYKSRAARCLFFYDLFFLSDECPPIIPMQWGFEDKIGERLIDVSIKRRKYLGYHNRYVFKK